MRPHLTSRLATSTLAVAITLASPLFPTDAKAAASPEEKAMTFLLLINRLETIDAKLAQNISETRSLREYADLIEKDHENAMKQLRSIAAMEQLRLPFVSSLGDAVKVQSEHDAAYQALRNDNGLDFDKKFLAHEVEDHKMSLALVGKLDAELQPGSMIKDFLKGFKVTLQSHFDRASQLLGQF